MSNTDVLIVGAGPTGLVLALTLVRSGVVPRIVERNAGPGEASRAIVVHARTLEFYRQLGIADQVVDSGIIVRGVRLRAGSRQVVYLEFGELGRHVSPYPFALCYPQDDHERLLVEHLSTLGVEVEWNTELVDFLDDGSRVRATLRTRNGDELVDVAYLCGCDGARSTVREGAGLDFPGGTYEEVFYVADVQATGDAVDNEDLNGSLSPDGFHLVFPVRSSGMHRLIGVVPRVLQDRSDLTFEDIRPFIQKQLDVEVRRVNWFSRYHSHHRVASHFRVGRVFLAGDAGHVHSPAGGQGMNTGIGDAFNLAWKLAAVVNRRANASILDTYEPERIAFARTLVATTDTAFKLIAGRTLASALVRRALPRLWPVVARFDWAKRSLFRVVSQTRINYRSSALASGSAGAIRGGDRLPWAGPAADNFAPLRALDWQIHVYGAASPSLEDAASTLGLRTHEFPWTKRFGESGFERDAAYLVRPDGYVAVVTARQDADALLDLVTRFDVVTRSE